MGPGTKLPSLGHVSFLTLRDAYEVMARGLIEGGVDLLLIETCYDLLQAKAAMIGARRAMAAEGRRVPIQLQVTMETTGRMLVGSEIGAALVSLSAMKPDLFGLNCATGPREMAEHLRHLSQHSDLPISVLPNAGLPSVVHGRTHYDLTPSQLADHLERFVTDLGVSVIGGCCGTTPEHLRAVVERCRDLTPAPRAPFLEPALSSLYSPQAIEQDTSFLIIGERTNANGSKAFRDAMLASDWDASVRMAGDQIREGAHVLDVCVDYVGRDGAVDMDHLAGRLATQASVPLVLDSTEPPVMEAGLRHIGGRAVLNSANLEDGEGPGSRFDRVMSLAAEYGAAVICLLIDERGQARDVDWKMEVAHRIHDLATSRYGLHASDLIFDALTFPLSTGDDDAARGRSRDDRSDPPDQVRDPRCVHGARRVERVVRAQPRGSSRAQLGVPARVRRRRARCRDRARRTHRPALAPPRRAAPGLLRPRLRSPDRGLRPAAATPRGVRRRADDGDHEGGPLGLARRRAPQAPHHRRRSRRPRPRPRRGARGRHARAVDRERCPARAA